jgi:hypothetical protein
MRPDINQLLDKYWEGETSVEEEYSLKEYFRKGDINPDHLPFMDLFVWMDETASVQINTIIDIDILLDKYWEGETSLKEEEMIKAYFKNGNVAKNHREYSDLFQYFDKQKNVVYTEKENSASISSFNVERELKGNNVFSITKILFAVAAVSVLVFSAVTVFQTINDNTHKHQTAEIIEIEDPEEALRVTKEALALVSTKFRESQQTVRKNMEPLEKAAIFK